jgi:hypothetical protein
MDDHSVSVLQILGTSSFLAGYGRRAACVTNQFRQVVPNSQPMSDTEKATCTKQRLELSPRTARHEMPARADLVSKSAELTGSRPVLSRTGADGCDRCVHQSESRVSEAKARLLLAGSP